MKDNSQITLAVYNGNARPGELVVDLTQDPPPLYIGNNAGELTLISSGGAAALQLPSYADTIARDAAVSSPTPGMLVYVQGTGLQVYGATQWNTVAGTST